MLNIIISQRVIFFGIAVMRRNNCLILAVGKFSLETRNATDRCIRSNLWQESAETIHLKPSIPPPEYGIPVDKIVNSQMVFVSIRCRSQEAHYILISHDKQGCSGFSLVSDKNNSSAARGSKHAVDSLVVGNICELFAGPIG